MAAYSIETASPFVGLSADPQMSAVQPLIASKTVIVALCLRLFLYSVTILSGCPGTGAPTPAILPLLALP
jgi:hypothetical protein